MNFFKRAFGRRNWKIIYTCKCSVWRSTLGMFPHRVDAVIIVEHERERGLTRCYVTDGDIKTKVSLAYVVLHFVGVCQALDYYKIEY